MPHIGFMELVIILAIVVLLFGAKRIPDLARGLGEGIRGFRHAVKGEGDRDEKDSPKGP